MPRSAATLLMSLSHFLSTASCPPPTASAQLLPAAYRLLPTSSESELIDRLVASVSGELIMLSDIRAFMAFDLVDVKGAQEPDVVALDQLIERRLVLDEVRRYVVAEPPSSRVGEQIAEIRQRLGSDARFREALANVGYTEEDLIQVLRENERMRAYLDERFAAAGQPTDEEVLTYYQQHRDEFVRGGGLPPFESVRDTARQKVVADGRTRLIADWVAGLRRRATILRIDRK